MYVFIHLFLIQSLRACEKDDKIILDLVQLETAERSKREGSISVNNCLMLNIVMPSFVSPIMDKP